MKKTLYRVIKFLEEKDDEEIVFCSFIGEFFDM